MCQQQRWLPEEVATAGRQVYSGTTSGGRARRGYAEIVSFFDGLDLLGPGVVPVTDWRPDASPGGSYDLAKGGILAGVGRRPD